jgi:hypothetical protein
MHGLLFPFVTALPLLHYVDHMWFTITPPLMCADYVLGGRLPHFKSLLSGDHVMLRVHASRPRPLGEGSRHMSAFPPSIQFELYGLVNWVILLLGLYYLFLGRSPVHSPPSTRLKEAKW